MRFQQTIGKRLHTAASGLAWGLVFWALSLSLQAADVVSYGLLKGQIFEQTSGGTPALGSSQPYAFRSFVVPTGPSVVFAGMFETPGGQAKALSSGFAGDALTLEETFDSLTELNQEYGAGAYKFTLIAINDLVKSPTLNFGADNYPAAAPRATNLDSAQTVNPASTFTLTWEALAGATANDYVQLSIVDEDSAVVWATPALGQAGALNGGAVSAAIPGSTLQSDTTYFGRLMVAKIARDTTSYAGALGATGFFKETQFTLATAGGGTDTTPPLLLLSVPANQATGVTTFLSLVVFNFNEPMAAGHSIAWSTSIDADQFSYSWSGDKKSLTCFYGGSFPNNTVITWTLNPNPPTADGFADVAGNKLPAGVFSGQFTTASGSNPTNNPCYTNTDTTLGSVGVHKMLNYLQTSANPPVLAADSPALFSAAAGPPTNVTFTKVTLRLPNATVMDLTNFPMGSMFFHMEEFGDQDAMDTAFGSGSYLVTMTASVGNPRIATLSLPANGYPTTPYIANYNEIQNANPALDLTIRWGAFANVGPHDSVSIVISDMQGIAFSAPDPCVPRELANTATSVVVPKNTLGAGRTYNVSLTFARFTTLDTNTIPDMFAMAGYTKSTDFKLVIGSGGGPATQPKFTSYKRLSDGRFDLVLTGEPNRSYVIESTADFKAWSLLTTASSPDGQIHYIDAAATGSKHLFYRARQN